jgi:streptomycin 6-kinase
MLTLAEEENGDEVVLVAGRINRQLAIPAPSGLPRLRDQAHAWEEQLRKDADELTQTLSRYDVDTAVATVRELGRVQPTSSSTATSTPETSCAPTVSPGWP